ncbi:MarR family transcriptional regulator [Arthrobacter bambusae]|uniref:MarR family winged helix-turn-helix transcriptional regulator n=1 Tax=Arthrobacter bambusae TaxID=1338426 RepID=UPI001F50F94F|nr:MarR family transcriptional regulator [Arthrobacter bambusae]MCI0142629.1 MarR family transcriptional regulator [Arthrobacter bambusae]
MTSIPVAEQTMAFSLAETLYPLLVRLNTHRTLSSGKLGVLRYLTERGRATTSELAAVVHVSPQAISLAVRELHDLRLVVRVPDHEDRRRTWIELTDAGKQALIQELSAGRAWLDRAVAERLSSNEQNLLEAAIPVLVKLGSEKWIA